MTIASEVVYYWQKDAAKGYHLCAIEIIADPDTLLREHTAVINRIASDENKVDLMSGLIRVLAGAITAANGPATTPPANVDTTVPVCPDHGGVMQVSKYKNKEAHATYYCNRKTGEVFCKQQCDIMPDGTKRYRTTKLP